MADIASLVAVINESVGRICAGSLQIYGEWFGRPHDNIHTVVRAERNADILRVHFDEGETIDVWAPSGLELKAERFGIRDARKVRLEWYYYGREKTPDNRYFLEYEREGSTIRGTTNVDWYRPSFATDPTAPAVQIT